MSGFRIVTGGTFTFDISATAGPCRYRCLFCGSGRWADPAGLRSTLRTRGTNSPSGRVDFPSAPLCRTSLRPAGSAQSRCCSRCPDCCFRHPRRCLPAHATPRRPGGLGRRHPLRCHRRVPPAVRAGSRGLTHRCAHRCHRRRPGPARRLLPHGRLLSSEGELTRQACA